MDISECFDKTGKRPIEVRWFRQRIIEKYEVKFRGRLGPNDNDDKSIRILNRIVEWTDNGIKYEADQRHAELIVKGLGFNDNEELDNSRVEADRRQISRRRR